MCKNHSFNFDMIYREQIFSDSDVHNELGDKDFDSMKNELCDEHMCGFCVEIVVLSSH